MLFVRFVGLVQFYSHVLDLGCYEDAAALGARLGLANEKHGRVYFVLAIRRASIVHLVLPLVVLLLRVLLYVVELGRVHPGRREEIVMVRELFLKPFQVRAQGALPADVVHA